MTDIMSGKIADLMHNMSDGTYTGLIDEIASLADKQLTDYYYAEQKVDAKGKSPSKIKQKIHKELIENSDVIHPTIKKLHQTHSLADPKAYRQALEDQHYHELTSQLIEILFPSRTYTVLNEGKQETIKVDGLTELVQQIELHPELQKFFSQFKGYIISNLPDDTHKHISTLEKALVPIIQKFAVQSAKAILSKKLAELLKNGIESGMKANALDRALAEDILPPAVKAILPIFIGMILEKETKISTEQLTKLFKSSDLAKTRLEIGEKFYGLIKNKKQNAKSDYKNTGAQFSWDLLGVNKTKFINSYLDDSINETIKNCILKSMFDKENADTYDTIAELFKAWIEKDDRTAEEKIYRQIFELAKSKGIDIKWPKDKRDQSPFFIYMSHFVNDFKGAIAAVANSPSHENITLQEEEIKNIIRQQIAPFKEGEALSPYSSLLLDFLNIGEKEKLAYALSFFSGIIDQKLVGAMQCVRLSHRNILNGVLNGIQTSMTEQKIQQIIKPLPSLESLEEEDKRLNEKIKNAKEDNLAEDLAKLEKEREEIKAQIERANQVKVEKQKQEKAAEEKLDENMEALSRLLYDFIYFNIPRGGGLACQIALGSDYGKINTAVKKFKEKIADDPLMKKNLVFNVTTELVNALKEASRPMPSESLIA